MAASDHLHPQQLRLFMQAGELMDLPALDSKYYGWSMNQDEGLHNRKLYEARQPETRWKDKNYKASLEEDIRKHGVVEPVQLEFHRNIEGPMLSNGHHRVAAANSVNPKSWVPVEYEDY